MAWWSFASDRRGAIAPIFALVLVAIVTAAGVAIDVGRLLKTKADLQAALDAATLAAAHDKTYDAQLATFRNYLVANGETSDLVKLDAQTATLTVDGATLSGTASANVSLVLAKIFHPAPVLVTTEASVEMETQKDVEIALVLDVSSSMIEEGRFAPMKAAAAAFIAKIEEVAVQKVKIAVVPFSSRISIGLKNTSFLMAWTGNPAVPDRWINPSSYYGSSYSTSTWMDGVTVAKYNSTNYYWMGCVEPRLDFAVKTGGVTSAAITDASPSSQRFVPMDDNTQSGKSFCPTPVVPLSANFAMLSSAVGALTSQGSTRLDAGLIGGWYTLSPAWGSSWNGGEAPAAYGVARKIVVFMTDGKMNTQSNASGKHYDWLCAAATDCNAYATQAFNSTCTAIKTAGIEIFTISYDEDADQTNLKSCASATENFYLARSDSSGSDSIESVYKSIAAKLGNPVIRLTH